MTRLRQKTPHGRESKPDRPKSWWAFAGLTLIGLIVAFIIFVMFGIGECLPRDGSAHMQTCDAAKRRFFWLYPSAVACIVVFAAVLHAHSFRWARMTALASGFTAIVVVAFSQFLVG